MTALRSDWLLALGLLVSVLLRGAARPSRRARDARWRRRLAEQAAAAAQDRRLLLMARLDHELKNPLTAMRAAAGQRPARRAGLRPGRRRCAASRRRCCG